MNKVHANEKGMVQGFRGKAGTMECRKIMEREFSGWNDFQSYMRSSDGCRELIAFSAYQA